jgi:hypothetical protein
MMCQVTGNHQKDNIKHADIHKSSKSKFPRTNGAGFEEVVHLQEGVSIEVPVLRSADLVSIRKKNIHRTSH